MTTLAALLLAPLALAAPAAAHTGSHPFASCAEAKEHGYSNIPSSDTEHYAPKLDRDKDGWGCDKHGTLANDGKAKTGDYAEAEEEETSSPTPTPSPSVEDKDDEVLAETGGDSRAPYVASAGVLLLVGGGYMALRRRTNR